ncbi:hypothetical protein C8R48DRAFT_596433 [Suillus tomentosus]|nr:hypothetical protein C8R48DRAFT_596433 [Suillus tomentosus]
MLPQGELEHRCVKCFYPRVSKAKFTSGISKQQRRERILFWLAKHHVLPAKSKKGKTSRREHHDLPSVPFEESEPLAYSDPKAHYHIASSTRYFLNMPQWLGRHLDDRVLENFLPRLKDHLLAQILGQEYNGDETEFSAAEQAQVIFVNDRIFCHKVPRINYTTYDLRCKQDSLNPQTHADIMVLSCEAEHPYWYA